MKRFLNLIGLISVLLSCMGVFAAGSNASLPENWKSSDEIVVIDPATSRLTFVDNWGDENTLRFETGCNSTGCKILGKLYVAGLSKRQTGEIYAIKGNRFLIAAEAKHKSVAINFTYLSDRMLKWTSTTEDGADSAKEFLGAFNLVEPHSQDR